MRKWLRDRPWIWIIVLFTAFLAAWATLITIAVRNTPPSVTPGTSLPAATSHPHDS